MASEKNSIQHPRPSRREKTARYSKKLERQTERILADQKKQAEMREKRFSGRGV